MTPQRSGKSRPARPASCKLAPEPFLIPRASISPGPGTGLGGRFSPAPWCPGDPWPAQPTQQPQLTGDPRPRPPPVTAAGASCR